MSGEMWVGRVLGAGFLVCVAAVASSHVVASARTPEYPPGVRPGPSKIEQQREGVAQSLALEIVRQSLPSVGQIHSQMEKKEDFEWTRNDIRAVVAWSRVAAEELYPDE